MMRGRRRRGRHGRMPAPVKVGRAPSVKIFRPEPMGHGEPIQLDMAELEAVRLVDLEDLSQEAAGEAMGVSRGTIWRLLQSGRRSMVTALIEGRSLIIGDGEGEEQV